MHDLNYFSWLFLSINWFHSACQGPEGTTSPHGPCPASSGVFPSSAPHAQRLGGQWPVLGSPRLACPPAAASPHRALALCSWHRSFLKAGLQTGSGFLRGGKPGRSQRKLRRVGTQPNSHRLSFAIDVQRAKISPWVLIFYRYSKEEDVHRAECSFPTSLHPKKGLPLPHCFWELPQVHASRTLQIYDRFLLWTHRIFPRKMKTSLEKEHVSLHICRIKNMSLAEWLPTQRAAKHFMF